MPSVGICPHNVLILRCPLATYMWISLLGVVTMAACFCLTGFRNLGDIRVSGTLAAVRGAFAR